VLRSLIDGGAVARALARGLRPRAPGGPRVTPDLPAFGPDGRRLGDPRALHLDWSRFPPEYLHGPGAVAALNRALDSLSARDRGRSWSTPRAWRCATWRAAWTSRSPASAGDCTGPG
jgi:hypothetical protein